MTLPHPHARLEKEDLIRFETRLGRELRKLFVFTTHSLHFPASAPDMLRADDPGSPWKAHFDVEGELLTLPLVHQDRLLGVFQARGVTLDHPECLLPVITKGSMLCMDSLALYKSSRSDGQTGLLNRDALLASLEQEIEIILTCMSPGPAAPLDCPIPGYRANFALLGFRLNRLDAISRRYGYALGDEVLVRTGRILAAHCPEHAMSARLGEDSFALLWPQTNPRLCRRLGQRIQKSFSRELFSDPMSEDEFTSTMCIGFANYPQDMPGWQLRSTTREQCRLMLDKATLALDASCRDEACSIFSFRDVLGRGGRVTAVQPMHRVSINLGRGTGLQEGQRFTVWPHDYESSGQGSGAAVSAASPKGEIQVMEVRDDSAFAQTLHLNDPGWHFAPGDLLTPINQKESLIEQKGGSGAHTLQRDLPTGLLVYRDFIRTWSRIRQESEQFCLAMFKLDGQADRRFRNATDQEMLMQQVAQRCQSVLDPDVLGGRYSSNCLIFHVPGQAPSSLAETVKPLIEHCAGELGITLHVAIAPYPCLNFSRAEILDNCRKALEHAGHLPVPKMALFDSISLNIAADRLFSAGDYYGAMEEYKASLLIDNDNLVARNSLGICYARLGLATQAQKEFREVLNRSPRDVMALYNYGCVCLRLDEDDEARRVFEECIRLDPNHLFSRLRIGQMEEQAGRLEQALEAYRSVQELPLGAELSYSHLARIAFLQGERDQAMELLHKALLHNPMDAHSLHLLARAYLEQGEDREIVASLARKSVSLRPDKTEYQDLLARVLT